MPVKKPPKLEGSELVELQTLGTATVSGQRKIAIPKRAYEILELNKGDTIAFVLNENDEVEIHKVLFYRIKK
jgi:bifunctional DNA-binding transcriptional regulator/antitoxin component of YhaV-PrlF toxin-antitoxin module